MPDQFSRTRMLLGDEAVRRLAAARVAVFGLGGVGGCAAEALARAGVGALDLIDNDRFSLTNLNRQILSTHGNVGSFKTDEAEKRVRAINPDCRVTKYRTFYLPETAEQFDFTQYDYIIDAIDTVTGKLTLIENAKAAGTPIISSMGTGNKLDAAAFRVADLYKTSVCPLAKVMRRECRKRGIERLKVVYSEEPPMRPVAPSQEDTQRRDVPGSVPFVPPVAGFILAGEVIKDIVNHT